MAFDCIASAVDWLDDYRAGSLELLHLYAEDAVILCGCGGDKTLSGTPALRSYWTDRFERKPALELVDMEVLGGEVVAVSYRTSIDVVRSVLAFDEGTGPITLQRRGPV
jgi:ketosteroid isomerase-like protein